MRLSFVHIVDPVLFDPGTASLAGLARALGAEVARFAADFGSRQEDLMRALLDSRPDLVLFRLSGEVHEAVAHAVAKLREVAPDLPLGFYGPSASETPDRALDLVRDGLVLTGDPEVGLAGLLELGLEGTIESPPAGVVVRADGSIESGPPAPAADPGLLPPLAHDLFEPGLPGSAVGGSLFGEPGHLPLETMIGGPSGPSGNVFLSIFNQPTVFAPRARPVARLVEQVAATMAGAQAFDFVDREFGHAGSHFGAVLGALPTIVGSRPVTLRMLPSTANLDLIEGTAPGLVRRIALELDAVGGRAEDLPGAQTAAMLRPVVERLRTRGFELGLLVSAGLPFESADDLRLKLDFVRELAPEALRIVPFSPRHGHAWHRIAIEHDMMPIGEAAWNREVHVPLRQAILDEESWHLLWQDALNLQAERQLARAGAPG